MKRFNRERGKKGEAVAEKYLRDKGYKFLERNFSTRFGEIDLIFTKGNVLVFVEVKLKIGEDFGTPEEMITKSKIFQIERIGQIFLKKNKEIAEKYDSFRIDAVAVVLDGLGEVKRINHYENISF